MRYETRPLLALYGLLLTAGGASGSSGDNPPTTPPQDESAAVDSAGIVHRAAPILNSDNPNRIPGRYSVLFKSQEQLKQLASATSYVVPSVLPEMLPDSKEDTEVLAKALANAYRGKVIGVDAIGPTQPMRVFTIEISESDVKELAKDPRIELISQSVRTRVTATQSTPIGSGLWHLDRIDQAQLPTNGLYTYYQSGSGVHLYIVDTGLRWTHSQFGGRAASFVWDCTSGACSETIDQISQSDCNGHGTQVAGIAAGIDYGVAKGVQLRAYKVADCSGDGVAADMRAAVNHINVNQSQVARSVINLSLDLSGQDSLLDAAVTNAINSGIVFVASAGPSGDTASNACLTSAISGLPAVILVSASVEDDRKKILANWGSCVDLFAPGNNMKTADTGSDSDFLSGFSGSSAATPVVSGIAALYLQTHPTASPSAVQTAIVNSATLDVLDPSTIGGGSPNRLACALVPGNPDSGGCGGSTGGGGDPGSLGPTVVSTIIVPVVVI